MNTMTVLFKGFAAAMLKSIQSFCASKGIHEHKRNSVVNDVDEAKVED